MYDHTFLNLQIRSTDQTSGHTKWAVSLVIAYGHFEEAEYFIDLLSI